MSLHDFIECQLSNRYLDAHYIDWFPLVSYLFEVYGRDNVLVCLYEDLKKSPQGIADKIFSFLDVPSSNINPEKVNPSLSCYGLYLRRFMNHFLSFDHGASSYSFNRDLHEAKPSLYSKVKHRFIYSYYKPITNMVCYMPDKMFKLKKKPKLDKGQLRRINSMYANNNQKLSELIMIDLKRLGYPMP